VLLALTGYELALLFVAAVFVVFALTMAMVVPRFRPGFPGKSLWVFVAVCIGLFAAQLTAVLVDASQAEEHAATETHAPPTDTETTPTDTETTETQTTETETTTTETTETETTTEPEGQGDAAAGKEIFVGTAACGSCHTLADAGASGTIGPNLDAVTPSFDKVVERVTNGQGVMPSFADTLSKQQIQDVAAYVSSVAGG
jgi:mono/diheme cytochrome c family protein